MQISNERQTVKLKTLHSAFFVWPVAFLAFMFVLSGCVTSQVTGEIQKGRMELLFGDPKLALAHFQRAAELDPTYLLNLSVIPEGVWTYVGRAYYATGKLPEARKALEQARSRHQQDDLAKLYLGLVLARNGDQQRGLREIEAGLKGLQDWLYYLEQYHPDGRFWDPTRRLRSEIQNDLAMIKGKDINWKELIISVEWLGQQFEEEVDRARTDRERERRGRGRGLSRWN